MVLPGGIYPSDLALGTRSINAFGGGLKQGCGKQVFDALQEPDLDWLMIDSTDGASPPACSGSKKSDPASECLGQSVGGWTTKIHAAVDALGNPLRIILSVGQRADITQAESLLTGYETDAVLADRGYDANELIDWLTDTPD